MSRISLSARPPRARGFVSAVLLCGWLPRLAGCMPPAMNQPDEPNQPTPPQLSIELGYVDESDGSYQPVSEGEVWPLFVGFQGGSHIFVTLRARGFPSDARGMAAIVIVQRITMADSDQVLSDFSQQVTLSKNDEGDLELTERFIFLNAPAPQIDDRDAVLSFTLTLESDPTLTTSITQTVRLRT